MKKHFLFFLLSLIVAGLYAQDGPSSFYQTNPTFGKKVSNPIVVDGNPSEWSQDMLIVQGVANDDPRAFRGAHEGPIYDLYQLYAAWDENNLYLMWQITNVSDIASPTQGYPHSDNGKPWNGDIPFQIAFDIIPGEGSNGMLSENATEGVSDSHVWGVFNVFPDNNVDKMLLFSSKPGVGKPGVFSLNPTSGLFSYDNVALFNQAGVEYQWGDYCVATEIWGIPQDEHIDLGYEEQINFLPEHLEDETLYVDFLTYISPEGKKHDPTQETIYEIKIPLTALGIDATYLENEGIGVMLISTFGESGTNSLPFDATTLDNATVAYGPDDSSSHEKEDVDHFTAPFARIGKESGEPIIRPTINASPKGGTFIGGTTVTLTATGENTPLKIYYTLDGSNPTSSSTEVSSGSTIEITSNCTLKAITVDANGISSFVTTQTYITEEAPTPEPGTGITVYFKKPAGWIGDNASIWAWNDEGNLFSDWPGVAMTVFNDEWFMYSFDESVTSVNVIFSCNNGNLQSGNITNVTTTTCYEAKDTSNEFAVNTVDCPYTSIETIDRERGFEAMVYPNPSSDVIKLKTNADSIEIYSLDGVSVYSANNYQAESAIQIANLLSGIYFITIQTDNGSIERTKFLKK